MSALSLAAARVVLFSFQKMLATWVATLLGLISRARAVSLLLAQLITSLETLSWVTTLGGGMAPRRGTTHATAFSNGLGWAFILTVVHAFAGNIFAGIACTGLVFSA